MHPKNRYAGPHNFTALATQEPALTAHLRQTPDGRTSLNFAAPQAVYLLNRTLLKRDYGLEHWDLPEGSLTPAIPGRLDYVHLLADLVPRAERILDIGTGASLIYPILGTREYGWHYVATEVNPKSLRVARAIVAFNPGLRRVEVRQQPDPHKIFAGVIRPGEYYDATMCNPPFFSDRPAAAAAASAKWKKLGRQDRGLTFGGTDEELHTPGGEARFLRTMIGESVDYREQVTWFTTLVSKKGYLRAAEDQLVRQGATTVRVLSLAQGNKRMRVLAWKY